jgi:hypothetical protein
MRCRYLAAFALVSAVSAPAIASAQERPEIRAGRADDDAIAIDGRLDEDAWATASFDDRFTQKVPDGGSPPTQRTRFAVLLGDDALYVGVECLDSDPDAVVARLARRDRTVQSDSIAIDLDTRGDGASAFHFAVSAGGTMLDGVRSACGAWNADWDGLWDAAVSRDGRGWHAEIAIPLSTLRFSREEGLAFGLQVRREIARRHETDEWAYFPREEGGEIVHYGRLVGLDAVETPWPLDLAPYEVRGFRYRSRPEPDTLRSGWEDRWNLGLDATLRLGTSLALQAAVNPDFGQVEADELVLNLSTIETFYSEKRPFFLADRDLFSTPLTVFYTRRIGAVPEAPEVPDGWTLERNPDADRIWGALKLSGELAPGWTIATLDALAGRQDVGSEGPYRESVDRLADPLANFAVLRLRRDFGGDNAIGLLATAVNRFEPEGYPDDLCPGGGAPAEGRCFHDAYVAGLDGGFRTPDGMWSGKGQVAASVLAGGPTSTLADGTSLGSGDLGFAGEFYFQREGGHWRGGVDTSIHSAEYWPNDAGYRERGNLWRFWGDFGYWTDDVPGPLLDLKLTVEAVDRVSLDGVDLGQRYGLVQGLEFADGTGLWFEEHYYLPKWDDRETEDGAALERGGMAAVEVGVETDPNRAVTLEAWGEGLFWADRWYAELEGTVGFKPASMVTIDLAPSVEWQGGEPRWIETTEDDTSRRYLTGTLEAVSLGATLRATWAFTPRLTLQAYGQLFLAAVSYGSFREYVAAPGDRPAIALDDLRATDAVPSEDPDFSEAAVNATVLLRWEYLPGSLLYLVYTHAEMPTDVTGDGKLDPGLLADAASSDTFLVKLSYLWN